MYISYPPKNLYNQQKSPLAVLPKCGDYFAPQEIKKTPWSYRKSKKFKRLKKPAQLNLCEQLNRELCLAASKSCCFIEDQATEWYKRQKELRTFMLAQKRPQSEPCLDLKPNIRELAEAATNKSPLDMGTKSITYISPEFQELLKQHDERMRERYLLNNLPKDYTRRRLRKFKQNVEQMSKEEVEEISEHSLKTICSCDKKFEVKKKVEVREKKEVKPVKKEKKEIEELGEKLEHEDEDKFTCCGLRKKEPIKTKPQLESPKEPLEKEDDEDIPKPEKSEKDLKPKFSKCFNCFKSDIKVKDTPPKEEKEELEQPKVCDYYRPRVLNYYKDTDETPPKVAKKPPDSKAAKNYAPRVLSYETKADKKAADNSQKATQNLEKSEDLKTNESESLTSKVIKRENKKLDGSKARKDYAPRVLNYETKTVTKNEDLKLNDSTTKAVKSSKYEKTAEDSNEKRKFDLKPRIRSLRSTINQDFPATFSPGPIEIIRPFSQNNNNKKKNTETRISGGTSIEYIPQKCFYTNERNDSLEEIWTKRNVAQMIKSDDDSSRSYSDHDSFRRRCSLDSKEYEVQGRNYSCECSRSSLESWPRRYSLESRDDENKYYNYESPRSSIDSRPKRYSLESGGSLPSSSYNKQYAYQKKPNYPRMQGLVTSYRLRQPQPFGEKKQTHCSSIKTKAYDNQSVKDNRCAYRFNIFNPRTSMFPEINKYYCQYGRKSQSVGYNKARNFPEDLLPSCSCERDKERLRDYCSRYKEPNQDPFRYRDYKDSRNNCVCCKSNTPKLSRMYDYDDHRSLRVYPNTCDYQRFSKEYRRNSQYLDYPKGEMKGCNCNNSQRNNARNMEKYPTSYGSQTYDRASIFSYKDERIPPPPSCSYYNFKVDDRYFRVNPNSCNCYKTNNEKFSKFANPNIPQIFRETPSDFPYQRRDDSGILRMYREDRNDLRETTEPYHSKLKDDYERLSKRDDLRETPAGYRNKQKDAYERPPIKYELRENSAGHRTQRRNDYKRPQNFIENRDEFRETRYRAGSKDSRDSRPSRSKRYTEDPEKSVSWNPRLHRSSTYLENLEDLQTKDNKSGITNWWRKRIKSKSYRKSNSAANLRKSKSENFEDMKDGYREKKEPENRFENSSLDNRYLSKSGDNRSRSKSLDSRSGSKSLESNEDNYSYYDNGDKYSLEHENFRECKCQISKSCQSNGYMDPYGANYFDSPPSFSQDFKSQKYSWKNKNFKECKRQILRSDPYRSKCLDNTECNCSSRPSFSQGNKTKRYSLDPKDFGDCKCQISRSLQSDRNFNRYRSKSLNDNECKCLSPSEYYGNEGPSYSKRRDQKAVSEDFGVCDCQNSASRHSRAESSANNDCKCRSDSEDQGKVFKDFGECKCQISAFRQPNKNLDLWKGESSDNNECKSKDWKCKISTSPLFNKNSDRCEAKSFFHKECKCSSSKEHRRISQASKVCKYQISTPFQCDKFFNQNECKCCSDARDQRRVSQISEGCKGQESTSRQSNKNSDRSKSKSLNNNECKCLADSKDQRRVFQALGKPSDNNECKCCSDANDQRRVCQILEGCKCQESTSRQSNKNSDRCKRKYLDNNECKCLSDSKHQRRISPTLEGSKCQDSISRQSNKNFYRNNECKCCSDGKYQEKISPTSEDCNCQIPTPCQCEKNYLDQQSCDRQSCKYQAQECPLSPQNKKTKDKKKNSSDFKECLCSSISQNKKIKDKNKDLTKFAEYFLGTNTAKSKSKTTFGVAKVSKSDNKYNGTTNSCMKFESKKSSDFKECSCTLPNSPRCSRNDNTGDLQTESDIEYSEEKRQQEEEFDECFCNSNNSLRSSSSKESTRSSRSPGVKDSEESLKNSEIHSSNEDDCVCNIDKVNSSTSLKEILPKRRRRSKGGASSKNEATTSKDARDSSLEKSINDKEQMLLEFGECNLFNKSQDPQTAQKKSKEIIESLKELSCTEKFPNDKEIEEFPCSLINSRSSVGFNENTERVSRFLRTPASKEFSENLEAQFSKENDGSCNIDNENSANTFKQNFSINFERSKGGASANTGNIETQDHPTDATTSPDPFVDASTSQDTIIEVKTSLIYFSDASTSQNPFERFKGGASSNTEVNKSQYPHTDATTSQYLHSDPTTSQDPLADATTSQGPRTEATTYQDSPTNAKKSQTPLISKKKSKALYLCCTGPQRYSSHSDSEDDKKSNFLQLSFKDSLCCTAHRRKTREKIVRLTSDEGKEEIVVIEPPKLPKKCKLPLRPPGAATFLAPANVSKNHEACFKDSHYWLGITPNYPQTYQERAKKQQLERDHSIARRQKLWAKTCPRAQPSKEFYQAKRVPDILPNHRKCFSGTFSYNKREDEAENNNSKRKKNR